MNKKLLTPLFAVVLLLSAIGLSTVVTEAQTLDTGGFVNTNTAVDGGNASLSDFQPLTKVQGTPFESVFGSNATLGGFFQTLFSLSITIGALLAVLMLAWSGYQYILTDVVKIKGDAKQRIQNALIGLLMLLATVLILRQINPDIVSLRILTNTGTPNVVTGTTPGNPTSPGVGTPMTEPRGFCFDTGGGGYHASDYNRYICFATLAECAAGRNINMCSAYSTTNNDSYGPGNTPLPAGVTNYSIRRWFSGDDPGLNTCPQKGPGWVGLTADVCGANPNAGGGQCCGIPKQASYETAANVPANYWCYNTGNTNAGTKPFHCSVDQAMCSTDRTTYTQTAGQVGVCAQNILDSNGHSSFVTPIKTYSAFKYSTQLQVDSAGVSPVNACASPLLGGAGYEEVAVSTCTPNNSSNLGNATTGKCCALPSN